MKDILDAAEMIKAIELTTDHVVNLQTKLEELDAAAMRRADLDAIKLKPGPMGKMGPEGPMGPRGPMGKTGPMGPMGPKGPAGEPGADGRDGMDGSPDTAEQIRNKLENLVGKERMDISAIKGSEELVRASDIEDMLKKRKGRFAVGVASFVSPDGGTAITLETDGVLNGDQTLLNLIAGTNITLTDDGVGGVTIDATGGAGTPSMQTANYGTTVDYSAGAPANNTNLSFDDNSTPNTGTVYLPDGVGTIGDVITINDLLGVSSTSNIIIDAGGGNTITWSGGVTQTALMSVDGSSYTLRLISATQWMLE